MKVLTNLLLVILSLSSLNANAQEGYDKSIESSFEKYKKAFVEVDRSTLLTFVHPNIIEMGGGPEFVIDEITSEYNMYAALGISLKDIVINESSKVLESQETLQAMVPYVKTLEKDSRNITEKGFFLAISQDKGKTWFFTDMKKHDAESIKLFIPNYNERLNIYLNSVTH